MKRIPLRYVVVYGLAAALGGLLLHVSHKVQKAESKMQQLQQAVSGETDKLNVLKAEWEYLNNPERLEKLAQKYLDLVPPAPARMISNAAFLPDPVKDIAPQDYKDVSGGNEGDLP